MTTLANTITNERGQLQSVTGPAGVQALRLRALIGAVRLESKGLRMSRRGPSATAIAKTETGLRTNDRAKLIAALEQLMAESVAQCTIVTDGEVSPPVDASIPEPFAHPSRAE